MRRLTDAEFVDWVRVKIGLLPMSLGIRTEHVGYKAADYTRLQALRQRARPDCDRCGGSGYYDGEKLEMFCDCTGLEQRPARRGGAGSPKRIPFRQSPRTTTR